MSPYDKEHWAGPKKKEGFPEEVIFEMKDEQEFVQRLEEGKKILCIKRASHAKILEQRAES